MCFIICRTRVVLSFRPSLSETFVLWKIKTTATIPLIVAPTARQAAQTKLGRRQATKFWSPSRDKVLEQSGL